MADGSLEQVKHLPISKGINSLQFNDVKWKELDKILKNDLAMKEWFHNCKDKNEVNNARNNIALVLCSVPLFFPRSDKTNRYNIPKMHGMTKMQEYIKLFGNGMNLYSGPGESAHKAFVKLDASQCLQVLINARRIFQ